MALQFEPLQIPFGYGLQQQADPRALQPPALSICRDAEFSAIGGLQTRRPYAPISNAIVGGGTLADVRRIASQGDELLCITRDSLYSWSEVQGGWVRRATHLGAVVDEKSLFTSTNDMVDCDRAELGGFVFYTWSESPFKVFLAAVDKETGAFVFGPAEVTGGRQPKLVTLQTKLVLFCLEAGFLGTETVLVARVVDPSTILSPVSAPVTLYTIGAPLAALYYDAARIGETDRCVIAWTSAVAYSEYRIATAVAASTLSSIVTAVKSRPCGKPLALAVSPDATRVQVVRISYSSSFVDDVNGDLIDVTSAGFPADVFVDQALGSVTSYSGGPTQVTATYLPSSISGAYRCAVIWSIGENTGSAPFEMRRCFVDTSGAIVAAAIMARRVAVASHAFVVGSSVYVWGAFAGTSIFGGANAQQFRAQLQNTYFLYRDDGLLVAKAVSGRAGGFAYSTGRLPSVTRDGDSYTWLANERRIIELGGESHTSYAARVPREVSVTFDAPEARRTAQIGKTLYFAGGEILQYDGDGLTEVGFHVYPWEFGAIELPSGSIAGGAYGIKCTLRWENRRGEIERSTTATVGTIVITTPPNGIDVQSPVPLHVTHKTAQPPAVEIWRTLVNPSADSNFYLITSKDPRALSGNNRYLANDANASSLPTVHDVLDDAALARREQSPENGLALEPISPPPAKIIVAGGDRIFLAGIAGEPYTIWYSKQRGDGHVVAFNDGLRVELPSSTGPITAIAMNGETVAAFTATAVYMLAGDGFTNDGQSSNYAPQKRSDVVGAISQEAVLDTDRGVVFQSRRGWHLLNRGWAIEYIGGPVKAFDGEPALAMHSIEDTNEIRILTENRLLFLDVVANQWGERSISGGRSAAIWRGRHCYLDDGGVRVEQDSFDLSDYAMDVATAWIKPADLQGYVRVRKIQILGERLTPCRLRIRIAYDYNETYVDDRVVVLADAPVLKIEIGPRRQQVSAIKVRISVLDLVADAPPQATAAVRLTGIALLVGYQPGLSRRVAAAQKA